MFGFLPPAVFILTVVFGRVDVRCFGGLVTRARCIPVIGARKSMVKGDLTLRTLGGGGDCVGPIVHVTITSRKGLFLYRHPRATALSENGVSVPVRYCPNFKRSLTRKYQEVVRGAFPNVGKLGPAFDVVCRFRGTIAGELICLFILSMRSSSVLYGPRFGNKGL